MMLVESTDTIKNTLLDVFGYSHFRGNQEEIITNLLSGKDTFVIMPTGAGKSLCYQLPALVMEGTAVVISPLIALMKNQVDQLRSFGINAYFLNSTLSKAEITKVKKETLAGNVKLLYVAPESLTKADNVDFLKDANVSFVAIDEAHCISEWGHDFRPEYRRIKSILSEIDDNLPLIALTATATPKVQLDILKNLGMEGSQKFQSSFYRENLYYEVRPKQQAKKQLIHYVQENKGKSGIVYCLSRKKVEEIANLLCVNGIKAAPYHAGLDAAVRMKNQDDFLNEDVDVIVATIAFGMGIDKPDVRFVIHYDVPKSLEGYYQETGRSGRDGLEGKCVMFYSHNDINKLEKFHKDKSVTERDNARILLQEMTSYAESAVCRVRQLLHYFGESFEKENCGYCDNCVRPKEKYEGKEYVNSVLKTVELIDQRFGLNHIVSIIRGSENQYVKSYGHDQLETYKVGDEESEEFWKSVVRQSLLLEFLEKDIDQIGVLKISEKGRDFLKKPYSVTLSKDHDYNNLGEEEEPEKSDMVGAAYDKKLFNELKILRKQVAKEKGLPPYVIFQDPSLEEMSTTYPTTREELEKVIGVGKGKAAKFGAIFMEAIKEYVEDNDIITASDVIVKTSANKSKNKVFIIQQIDKKMDLEEISESLNVPMEDLLLEIESIVDSGTNLNLDYYVDQVIDPDHEDDLYDYFMNADSDSIEDALNDSELEDYAEEEIRLIRIKFLCEYAH